MRVSGGWMLVGGGLIAVAAACGAAGGAGGRGGEAGAAATVAGAGSGAGAPLTNIKRICPVPA